jgi:GeoRSP system SPASM domain protein
MELSTPITIYWDLPGGTADGDYLLRISSDIKECRPLMLQLHDPAPTLRESTIAVLESFKGSGIAVSFTICGDCPERGELGRLHSLGLKEILIDVQSVEEVRGALPFMPAGTGISFRVTAGNWEELPTLLSLCKGSAIRRLVLPMQRLYTGEPPYAISREEQRELAASLAYVGAGEGLEMTIHDPFLWRSFNPGIQFPQGGCQAANTMMAIAPNGGVYPCPALPVDLGRIGENTLKEIIASTKKKEFRSGLLQFPTECRGCSELDECRGGCRGRSCAQYGTIDRTDPACE